MALSSATSSAEFYVYQAAHQYVAENGTHVMKKGDIIEVFDIPEEYDFRSPATWLDDCYNRSSKENVCDVPGNYLIFLHAANIAESWAKRHLLKPVYVLQPVLCNCCDDFIWQTDRAAMRCDTCKGCYHQECSLLRCDGCVVHRLSSSSKPTADDTCFSKQPLMVSDWSVELVAKWLATVNLYKFCPTFISKQITGDQLPSIDDSRLKSEMNVDDEFHRKAILLSINDLLTSHSQADAGAEASSPSGEEMSSDQAEHQLVEHTYSTLQKCHRCQKYLYGIIRQGLLCTECGLSIHRHCAVFKLPSCGRDKLARQRPPSYVANPLFGVSLESQVTRDRPIPEILERCVTEIERKIADGAMSDGWRKAYRISAPTDSVAQLKKRLENRSSGELDLRSCDLSLIGSVVKKYLRELPDPLIPLTHYDKFVKAAELRQQDETQGTRLIVNYYNELSEVHHNVLKYMLTHFCKILPDSADFRHLDVVFARHILLRPDWPHITDVVHNLDYHRTIISVLYENQRKEYNEQSMTSSAPPPLPPLPNTNNLDGYPWFWGDVTREEVHDRMSGIEDGAFLIRKATSHAVNGDYTLTLRKSGTNRLIKIYHENGKYGFTRPLEFNSVAELVKYFSNNSLAEYNNSLDCKLRTPVCRSNEPSFNVFAEDDLLKQLQTVHSDFSLEIDRNDKDIDKHSRLAQELQNLYQASEAFREITKVFEDQLSIHRAHQSEIATHDYQRMHSNYQLVEERLKEIKQSKQRVDKSIEEKKDENKRLILEINSKKPRLKQLEKRREQLTEALESKGWSRSKIDSHLVAGKPVDGIMSLRDDSNWFCANVTRSEAESMLSKTADGTFLIRHGGASPYALSIMYKGHIKHCKIERGESGYGFAEPFLIHQQLRDLVLHYSETSLAEHNPDLDTVLQNPVNSIATALYQ